MATAGLAGAAGMVVVIASIPDGMYAMAFHRGVIGLVSHAVAVLSVCLVRHLRVRRGGDDSPGEA